MAEYVCGLEAVKHIEVYLISENTQFLSNNIMNTCTEYGCQLRKFVQFYFAFLCNNTNSSLWSRAASTNLASCSFVSGQAARATLPNVKCHLDQIMKLSGIKENTLPFPFPHQQYNIELTHQGSAGQSRIWSTDVTTWNCLLLLSVGGDNLSWMNSQWPNKTDKSRHLSHFITSRDECSVTW